MTVVENMTCLLKVQGHLLGDVIEVQEFFQLCHNYNIQKELWQYIACYILKIQLNLH